jgi:hypothetical protein
MIADNLLIRGLNLDKKGFCVGNIAPDCNVENEDWTSFTPSREVTHWMKGQSKLTSDYEDFYKKYIKDESFTSNEQYSFLLGYYSHLITDVEFQRFIRDEHRVKNTYDRIKTNGDLREKVIGYSEDFDTLKKIFEKNRVFYDIKVQETNYLKSNPTSGYNTVLQNLEEFPDYLDFFPQGAIIRKIRIMANKPDNDSSEYEFLFFSKQEFEEFIYETSNMVYRLIKDKISGQ